LGDQLGVANGLVANRELEQTMEDEPPAAGVTTVEAEDKLIEVSRQMCGIYRTLVGAEKPTLGEGVDSMGSREQGIDVFTRELCCPPAPRLMQVAELLQPAIGGPAVGDHGRAWLDVGGYEGVQGGGRRVAKNCHPASAKPGWFVNFNRHPHKHLVAQMTAAAASLLATEEALVNLDPALQTFPARPHQNTP
jgi:hypothetical protein